MHHVMNHLDHPQLQIMSVTHAVFAKAAQADHACRKHVTKLRSCKEDVDVGIQQVPGQ